MSTRIVAVSTAAAVVIAAGSGLGMANHFDWNLIIGFRVFALIAASVAVLNFVVMLSHYWFRVMPLRREIGEGEILAPPVFWTFGYHVVVFGIVAYVAAGQYLALSRGIKPSFLTFVTPFLMIAVNVCIQRFSSYYSDALNSAAWKKRLASLEDVQTIEK